MTLNGVSGYLFLTFYYFYTRKADFYRSMIVHNGVLIPSINRNEGEGIKKDRYLSGPLILELRTLRQ